MTGTELVTMVRVLISEATEDFFDTDNIAVFLNASLEKYAGQIQHKFAEYYYKTDTVTVLASTQYIALPSDCTGVIKSVRLADDTELRPRPPGHIYEGLTGTPSHYFLAGDNIWMNTTVGAATVLTLYYYYVPTAIASGGGTEIDFPKMDHALLAYDAAIPLLIKNGRYNKVQALMGERDRKEKDLWANLGNRMKGRPVRKKQAYSQERKTDLQVT